MGEEMAIKYIQISLRNFKEQKNSITSNHSPYVLRFSKWNAANHLIFQLKFPDFPCKW